MDFIERWLHVAPDGGNGTLEFAYLAAALTAALTFAYRRALLKVLATKVGFASRR